MSEEAFSAEEVLDLMEELAKRPLPTETDYSQEFGGFRGGIHPGMYTVTVFESEDFFDNLGDDYYPTVRAAYERANAVWTPLRDAAIERWGPPGKYDATVNFKAGRPSDFDNDLLGVGETFAEVWLGPGNLAFAMAGPGQAAKEIGVSLIVCVLDRRLVSGPTTGGAG